MNIQRSIGFLCVTATMLTGTSRIHAELPTRDAGQEAAQSQRTMMLPVKVVDTDGKPITDAKVTPWALRSSQGHGLWQTGDERAAMSPNSTITNADGLAVVRYPYFRDIGEQTRTLSVSINVDHSGYAFSDNVHIDVPLLDNEPRLVTLKSGVPVEIQPVIDGEPAELDDLHAIWSDGRSWQPGSHAERLSNGRLRIPAMPPGENSILLVRIDGDQSTHFSKVIDFELVVGETKQLEIQLKPAVQVHGRLSGNVPRPVQNGRLKLWTLNPQSVLYDRASWFTWAPIERDGTFTVNWPADERLQVIGLCDGFIAESGTPPDVVKDPRNPESDPFQRPQVFAAGIADLELAMTPLVRCEVTVEDDESKPFAGVTVRSWPNVGWWNNGSQLYCYPLVRGERRLILRNYMSAIDEAFPQPFSGETDANGRLILELPDGQERLAVDSDLYEMPVFLGQRDQTVNFVSGEITKVTLHLQPAGTEQLGEWDKLAGVVFGCSTREGRSICALPKVRQQMDEFVRRFREAKNKHDPQLLSEAYAAVADAFEDVGDLAEAKKWQVKAAEQAVKAKQDKQNKETESPDADQ